MANGQLFYQFPLRSDADASLGRWYRIWVFFLAYSTIISRQGSASVFQLTLHKNLNAYHRINGVPSHASIHVKQRDGREWVPIE